MVHNVLLTLSCQDGIWCWICKQSLVTFKNRNYYFCSDVQTSHDTVEVNCHSSFTSINNWRSTLFTVNLNKESKWLHISINKTSLPTLKLQTSNVDMNVLLGTLSCAARTQNKFFFILGTYHTSVRESSFNFQSQLLQFLLFPCQSLQWFLH